MTTSPSDPIAAFCDAISGAGLPVPETVTADGRLHRFSTNGKRGDDAGAYVLHADGEIPAGWFGCWRSGISETWHARSTHKLTAAEKREHRRRLRAIRAEREAETARQHQAAATRAAQIWAAAQPATAEHGYLARKGVGAYGLRVDADGVLIIPMRDSSGALCSLQLIDDDGEKLYLPGGRVKGGYHSVGRLGSVLYIAEGYATAASAFEATREAAVVAFDAGNLAPVAEALHAKYPAVELVLCADNDVRDDDAENTGVAKATAAAAAIGARVAVPELGGRKCDFNDVHVAAGLDEVRRQLQVTTAPEVDDDALIAELATLGPIRYGQRRKEVAGRLGVSVGAVDEAVRAAQREAAESDAKLLFPEIAPTTEPVDGGELLTEIAGEISRYIVLSEHELTAATLWALYTHAVEAFYVAPILAVQSPQKRCGKTQLLKILCAIVCRGLLTENFSLAALYRVMDEYRPTLLIDEADAFMDAQEEIRGIINSGHSRGTRTLRIGGENRNEIEVFDSFGPKAVAGIGKRRDTIADRAITIKLRRRRKDERVELLRLDRLEYRGLLGRCAGWAVQNMGPLRDTDPAMPEVLHDRAQDNWRPLIAIADVCGWGAKARQAAMALTDTDDSDTVGAMALEDIRRLFTGRDTDRLSSADIVEALAEMEERPWPEWGRSRKPITQRQLAKLLEPFEVSPKNVRVGTKIAKGYELAQFADSFSRYLISGVPAATPLQPSNGKACGVISSATAENDVADRSATATNRVADEKRPEANNGGTCSGVAVETPKTEGKETATTWTEI